MKYYSQSSQDYIIDKIFNGKRNGTFLDIGAHDGIFFSNSYFFETSRGWKGVCVEPIPELFEELRKNRACFLVNGAINESSEKVEFQRVHGYAEMLSGILKYRDPRHEERTLSEISQHGGKTEIIQVQGYTIQEILEKFNLATIDYLSIDIEGGEYEMLQSIDFNAVDITCLTIENAYSSSSIRKLMSSQGYSLIFSYAVDDFYVKRKFLYSFSFLFGRLPKIWKFWATYHIKIIPRKIYRIIKSYR